MNVSHYLSILEYVRNLKVKCPVGALCCLLASLLILNVVGWCDGPG